MTHSRPAQPGITQVILPDEKAHGGWNVDRKERINLKVGFSSRVPPTLDPPARSSGRLESRGRRRAGGLPPLSKMGQAGWDWHAWSGMQVRKHGAAWLGRWGGVSTVLSSGDSSGTELSPRRCRLSLSRPLPTCAPAPEEGVQRLQVPGQAGVQLRGGECCQGGWRGGGGVVAPSGGAGRGASCGAGRAAPKQLAEAEQVLGVHGAKAARNGLRRGGGGTRRGVCRCCKEGALMS